MRGHNICFDGVSWGILILISKSPGSRGELKGGL